MGGIVNLTGVPGFDALLIIKDDVGFTPVATVNVTGAGYGTATTTNTYAHNLGFIPIPLGVINAGGFYFALNYSRTGGPDEFTNIDFYEISVKLFSDMTNLYVQTNLTIHTTATAGLTVSASPIKYLLARRRANQ